MRFQVNLENDCKLQKQDGKQANKYAHNCPTDHWILTHFTKTLSQWADSSSGVMRSFAFSVFNYRTPSLKKLNLQCSIFFIDSWLVWGKRGLGDSVGVEKP